MKVVRRIVEERKTALRNTDEKPPIIDFVDVLLRDIEESSEMQRLPSDFITGNIIELMVPGEETMPTAMTLVVKFLSDCPVALEKLMVRTKILDCFLLTWILNQRWGLSLISYMDGSQDAHVKI